MSFLFASDRRTSIALSLSAVAFSGSLMLSVNSDRLIESAFNRVMVPGTIQSQPTTSKTAVAVAGSEEFWLQQAADDAEANGQSLERVVWSTPLGVGDRFVVGTGAARKQLKVVAVQERKPDVTRIEVGSTTAKQLWVQAQDESGGTLHTMRLDVEPSAPAGRTL